MVDFTLTDEQKNLREMAHDFAEKEIRPVAWEYDKDGTWPQDIIEKAWDVGLMNSHIPEEYGGAGAGYLEGCLIEEELSWGCSGIQTSLGCNGLATAPIALGGSEETKKKYLGMLTEAPKLASFCLTEPDAGLGRVGDAHDGRQAGRQVRDQRLEVLHHQRRLRRLLHGLREDRQGRRAPRHQRVRRRARLGRGRGQEGGQARAARVEHGDDLLQRRRGPRGESAGRGKRRASSSR